jgi:superfamily I DNA/RNA helicase
MDTSQPFRSKYSGFCRKCYKHWGIGEEIVKDPTYGYMHAYHNKPPAAAGNNGSLADALFSAVSNAPVSTEEPAVVKQPNKPFVPSKYQLGVFDFITNGTGHAVVEAVAGSGKTTTIVEALKLTKQSDEVAFVAFNKHIARELASRSPEWVKVCTLHSMGLGELRKHYGHIDVDEDKMSALYDTVWPVSRWITRYENGQQHREPVDAAERAKNFTRRSLIRKMMSLAKAILLDVNDRQALEEACERYGIDLNGDEEEVINLLPLLPQAMQYAQDHTDIVDFDDMIWLPIVNNLTLTQYDWIFVDEAQDLNKSQTEMVLRSIKPTGRIVAVGDRAQSLYGFRGADTEAIPSLIKSLDATLLPLSITYRCPTSVVEMAKNFVPLLEARENAPMGEILTIKEEQFETLVGEGDMVLCRTNAPLVQPAFRLIRKGVKATIRGKDIGKEMVNAVEKFDAASLEDFSAKFNEWYQRELDRLLNRGKEMQAIYLTDRYETINSIMAECTTNTVGELISKIENLFSDDRNAVTFSSIHRAKGLEAERIFILRPDLMPHPKAKRDWELQQEINCQYVAFTRTKCSLFFVEKGG